MIYKKLKELTLASYRSQSLLVSQIKFVQLFWGQYIFFKSAIDFFMLKLYEEREYIDVKTGRI